MSSITKDRNFLDVAGSSINVCLAGIPKNLTSEQEPVYIVACLQKRIAYACTKLRPSQSQEQESLARHIKRAIKLAKSLFMDLAAST